MNSHLSNPPAMNWYSPESGLLRLCRTRKIIRRTIASISRTPTATEHPTISGVNDVAESATDSEVDFMPLTEVTSVTVTEVTVAGVAAVQRIIHTVYITC